MEVDRERAALHELNTTDIGSTIRTPINGRVASSSAPARRSSTSPCGWPPSSGKTWISGRPGGGGQERRTDTALTVASWRISRGVGDVTRKDLKAVVTVSSDVRAQLDGVDLNANAVGGTRCVPNWRRRRRPAERLHAQLHRQQQEQQESQSFLLVALLLAAF